MKTLKKVIILVMSSSNPVYQSLENAIKETWYNLKGDDVEIIFYKDSGSNNFINQPHFDGVNLILPCQDGFYTLGQKTLMAFDWVFKNYEFEYIYRSNLGAFVNVHNLNDFIESKPKTNFYCGIVGKDTYYLGKEVEFASGSGYFLSNDVVKIILDNQQLWKHHVVDDVALGELLSNFDIKVDRSAMRKNICDGRTFYQIGETEVNEISEFVIYHTRLRSNDRNEDIENMINIYKKIKN